MDTKKLLKLVIAVIITLASLWLLFQQISPSDILNTMQQIPLSLILIGFLLFTASLWVRAWRFQVLFQNALAFRPLFAVTCMHNILISLLPFRIGELSFPYLLKRRLTFTRALAVLAVGRIFDLIAMCVYFLIGLWVLLTVLPQDVRAAGKYAIWFTIAVLVALYVVLVHLKPFLAKRRGRHGMVTNRILAELHAVLDGIAVLKERGVLSQVIFSSALFWGLQFAWSWVVFRSMLHASFWGIVVGTTLPIVSTAIPIQGIAALGTFEVVWTLVFIALGVEKSVAIATGFAFHILSIVYAAVLGLWGAAAFGVG